MKGTRQKFLAGPGFASNEDGGIKRGNGAQVGQQGSALDGTNCRLRAAMRGVNNHSRRRIDIVDLSHLVDAGGPRDVGIEGDQAGFHRFNLGDIKS